MLNIGQNIAFPTSEVKITELVKSSCTSSYYTASASGKLYFLKVIPSLTPHLQELQFQEFTNTRLIGQDPHILQLIDQATLPSCKVFLLEHAEKGNLKTFLKNKELDEEQIMFVFKEILLAVIKTSDNGVVHRDISLKNVWIDSNFNFKLSGFERSFRLDDPRQVNVKLNSLKLTHPDLRPPDIEENLEVSKIDVWGLGCFLFSLIYRSSPYKEIQKNIDSAVLVEVLNACLHPDPNERPLPRKVLNMLSVQGIPTFSPNFNPCSKSLSTSRYSAKYSIESLVNTQTNPPDLFLLQQVSFETWTRPNRIPAVFKKIKENIQGVSVPDIKVLIIIHRILLSGPAEVLCPELTEALEQMLRTWTDNSKIASDQYFCNFNCGLIRQVCRNLIEKTGFHNRTKTNCNWKSQISQSDFQEVVAYLGRVVRICEGLTMGMEILPQINQFLAMQLIEECQRLMMCVKNLDRNSELQNFSSRLSALSFEPPSVKKEKFDTGQVVIPPSPRSRPVLQINPSCPTGPLVEEEVKSEFSKTSLNFRIEKSPDDLIKLEKPQDREIISKKMSSEGPSLISTGPNKPFKQQPDLLDLIDLDFAQKKPNLNESVSVKPSTAGLDPPQIEQNIKNPPSQLDLAENKPLFSKVDPPMHPQKRPSSTGRDVHKSHGTPVRPLPSPPKVQVSQKPVPKPSQVLEIDKRWIMSKTDIKLGTVLGEGASCTVFKGEFKRTPVAVKIMRGSYAGQNIVQEFQREVTAMIALRHPNLVLFMGAAVDPQMMIISEFCRGESLFKLLHEKRQVHLSWNQKFKMIIDIARGMLYLHEAQPPILHRDLKSLNLLLMDLVSGPNDFVMTKVTDFGIARILDEVNSRMTMQVGTCHWMAPEVINSEPYSLAADIYSFGIVLWEIAARETPYKGINPIEIPIRVLRGERPDLALIGPAVPASIKDLIRRCWDQSPVARPTFRQIIEALEQIQGPFDY